MVFACSLGLGRLKREHLDFEAIVGYMARCYLKYAHTERRRKSKDISDGAQRLDCSNVAGRIIE